MPSLKSLAILRFGLDTTEREQDKSMNKEQGGRFILEKQGHMGFALRQETYMELRQSMRTELVVARR